MTSSSAARSTVRSRRAVAALVCSATSVAGLLATPAQASTVQPPTVAASAAVNEVIPVAPNARSLTLQGRGYGHGRGMSQWGAYGAADAGLAWRQILDFYYPGTSTQAIGNPEIRVWLSADTDGDTHVMPAPGLAVTVGTSARTLPVGAGYTAWRGVGVSGRIAVQYRDAAGAWRPFAIAEGTSARFSTRSGLVRVVLPGGASRDVRGAVSAVADPTATKGVRTVLNSTMDSYLRGVVPSEMPASWPTQALTAQSVAARTYAASYRERQRAKGATWDICDTVTCQVFKGAASYDKSGRRTQEEKPRTDAAIANSAGVVLRTKAGNFALTEFSASNGGWSVAGGPSYQVAKADPYDGRIKHSHTSWTASVDPARISTAYGVGPLKSITVTKRSGDGAMRGRVLAMTVTGQRGSKVTTGAEFRRKLGLKSEWFAFAGAAPVPQKPVTKPPVPQAPASGRDSTGKSLPSLVTTDKAGLLWLRKGGQAYAAPQRIGNHWHTMDTIVNAGDFDKRGGDDLIARQASTGRLLLYTGNGTGALRGPTPLTGNVKHLAGIASAGDFDGDGYRDLLAVDTRTRSIVLLTGAAGGKLGATKVVGKPISNIVYARGLGDLNGDGRNDIGWTDTRGRAYVGLGDGSGRIAQTVTMGRGWDQFVDVIPGGDVTGDGNNDVLALHPGGNVYVYAGTGTGRLGARTLAATRITPVLVAR